MPRRNEHEFLEEILCGNRSAVEFCETVFRISQTIDDLIDADTDLDGNDVVNAFWQSLIELPANPFYRENEPYLRPLMALALQDWRDSAVLERGNIHGQTLAYVLRDQLTSIVIQCTYLLGGRDWMVSVSNRIRDHFHDESLNSYLTHLNGNAETGIERDEG